MRLLKFRLQGGTEIRRYSTTHEPPRKTEKVRINFKPYIVIDVIYDTTEKTFGEEIDVVISEWAG